MKNQSFNPFFGMIGAKYPLNIDIILWVAWQLLDEIGDKQSEQAVFNGVAFCSLDAILTACFD